MLGRTMLARSQPAAVDDPWGMSVSTFLDAVPPVFVHRDADEDAAADKEDEGDDAEDEGEEADDEDFDEEEDEDEEEGEGEAEPDGNA